MCNNYYFKQKAELILVKLEGKTTSPDPTPPQSHPFGTQKAQSSDFENLILG